jgi:hypothetical protein
VAESNSGALVISALIIGLDRGRIVSRALVGRSHRHRG